MTVIIGGGAIGEALRARSRAIVINSKNFEQIAKDLVEINDSTEIANIIVTSGFLEKHNIGDFDPETIQKTVDANFIIPMLVANFSVANFPTTNLVFFSSSVVFEAREGYSAYSASKTGLEIFLRTLAVEHSLIELKIIRNSRTDTKLRWNNYKHSDKTEANLLTPDEVAKATLEFMQEDGIVMEVYKRNEILHKDVHDV